MKQTDPSEREAEQASGRSLSLLVAEDDIHTRLSLDVTFRRAVVRALVVESADALLERVAGMPEEERARIDLLVTDLVMPGTMGEELIRKLDADGLFLPVVVITAYGAPELEAEFRRRGHVTVLNKPFHPDDLVSAARDARRRFEKENMAPDPSGSRATEGTP